MSASDYIKMQLSNWFSTLQLQYLNMKQSEDERSFYLNKLKMCSLKIFNLHPPN